MEFKLRYEVKGCLEVASSSCCGAKLDLPEWHCRECGKKCDRVVTEEEVTLYGG
jgi:hypothetical protein